MPGTPWHRFPGRSGLCNTTRGIAAHLGDGLFMVIKYPDPYWLLQLLPHIRMTRTDYNNVMY
jgi:hypothetical protein